MSRLHFENIGWTVGNFCNATCGHCYSWKVRRDSREFLTETDVRRIVGQLVRLGVKTVNLGGNEPVYTHGRDIGKTLLPYIIRTLHEAGIPVGLTTNGVSFLYLDKYHPRELRMINDIDFSLDSPYQQEHDLNRGKKLYAVTIQTIQRALELGIDCSVIACGMRGNFNEQYLHAYLSLTELLGCEFRINTLKPVEPSLIPEMPTAAQFYEGFAYLLGNTDCITLGESCLGAFVEAGTEGCPCGTSSFRINAKTKEGTVPINPCVYMHEFKVGDLLSEDIFDIVESPAFTQFAARRQRLPRACRETDCQYLERCRGGCSARSYLIAGDLDSKDPYCPHDYVRERGVVPSLPKGIAIGCDHGIRVHDNYLCTWIGKTNERFVNGYYHALEQFRAPPGERPSAAPLSGCRQVGASEAAAPFSLQRIPVEVESCQENTKR